jgi:hypothetical protein
MKDKIYIGEGIMAQINEPLYYDDFTFDDILEMFQHADYRLCEDFGFMKHDWKNT